jgi:hypothetical protein
MHVSRACTQSRFAITGAASTLSLASHLAISGTLSAAISRPFRRADSRPVYSADYVLFHVLQYKISPFLG